MNKVETYTQLAINIANDNSHGYSQVHRWNNPDFDCSSLVIYCVEKSGIPVKTKGATYTGNMLNVFKKCGFKDVTSKVNLKTGSGLKRGDILLNPSHHTEIYIGNGKNVGAHIDEKGGVTGTKIGDNTGKEICTNNYYNYPWKYVLRYAESEGSTMTTTDITSKTLTGDEIITTLAKEVINGKYGSGETRKKKLGKMYSLVQSKVNELLK